MITGTGTKTRLPSIKDYVRCYGCGTFRLAVHLHPRSGEPIGNRCCGDLKTKSIAYNRNKDGILTAKVRFSEWVRYKFDRAMFRLGIYKWE